MARLRLHGVMLWLSVAPLTAYFRTVPVDTRATTALPCIIAQPQDAKRVLRSLRSAGWHPPRHARARLEESGRVAYQLSDAGAVELAALLNVGGPAGLQDGFTAVRAEDPKSSLATMVAEGRLAWAPQLNLHVPLTRDPHYAGETRSQFIRYLRSKPPIGSAAHRRPPAFSHAELFAGIGGFRLALEAASGGADMAMGVMACEKDAFARAIYQANWPGAPQCESIEEVDLLPRCDVLTAGFPCQPFRSARSARLDRKIGAAGGRRGFRDPRGRLVWHVLRLINARPMVDRPKAVLLENVRGILASESGSSSGGGGGSSGGGGNEGDAPRGSCLEAVLAELSASGYAVSFCVLDSQELLPQQRLRVYVVALRTDVIDDVRATPFAWPRLRDDSTPPPARLRDVLEQRPSARLEAYRIPPSLWAAVRSSSFFLNHPEQRVPSIDGPANTVRASYRSGAKLYSQFTAAGLRASKRDYESEPPLRFFTPRELARMQGFPEDFEFGAVPEAERYKTIGNAVSPPVVARICSSVLDAIAHAL